LQGNETAIAETIENNVRSKIIKEHLNDPAYYDKMSALLDEIIAARKQKALAYADYLKQIAQLARQVEAGHNDDTPAALQASPALRALYNNLQSGRMNLGEVGIDEPGMVGEDTRITAESHAPYQIANAVDDSALVLSQRIDEAVRAAKHDDWRGIPTRERAIKQELYSILQDENEVERIFLIIKAQSEY